MPSIANDEHVALLKKGVNAWNVRLFTRNGHDWTGHMLFRFCGKLSPRGGPERSILG